MVIIKEIDHQVIDIDYARKLISELGEDISCIKNNWCYKELYLHYNNTGLIDKVKQYFKQYPNAKIAYYLCYFKIVDRQWSEEIIEKCNAYEYAYNMARYCGSNSAWAKNIIEVNNNSCYAYMLALSFSKYRTWAENIIEKNNDPYSSYLMAMHCHSKRKWAEKIVKNSNNPEHKYMIDILRQT